MTAEICNINVLYEAPYILNIPDETQFPVLFSSPHSGRFYPIDFVEQSKLHLHDLRSTEDAFIDELFDGCVDLGCPMIAARFPRAFVDLNRQPYELDPQMFDDPLPHHVNTTSSRVLSGLGTIAKVVSEGRDIYAGKLGWAEAEQRITGLYQPYHNELYRLTKALQKQFGWSLLIDCHSMPHSAALSVSSEPDIILGDRFGNTCTAPIIDHLQELLKSEGLNVSRNHPYAGGYITRIYGSSCPIGQSIQIEVNRALYMNERTLKKNRNARHLKALLDLVMSKFLTELDTRAPITRIAAE